MQSKAVRTLTSLRLPAVNNGLFVVLSLAGAALSYLLYPVLAKIITPVQFGDVSVVIALAGQIGGLLLAFNVVSIYIVDRYEPDRALRLTEIIQKVVIQVLLVATVAVTLLSPLLARALKIDSGLTLLGLGVLLLLNVPGVVWTGFLQGHNELARIGVYNLVIAAGKLVGAVALALAGFGATGAIAGILMGQVAGLWVVRQVPGVKLPSVAGAATRVSGSELAVVRPLAKYVAESLIVVGVFSVLFAIDIVLAKAFFSPHLAGLYAGVSALGRIIFFGASILTWIMLANLSSRDAAKSQSVLSRYLALIAGLGMVVAGFWMVGGLIVRLSLGTTYTVMAPLLWLAGLNQLAVSLLYAYTLYLLVLRRGRPALLASLVCGMAITGAAFHHARPEALLIGLIVGQMAGYGAYAVLVSGRKLMRRTR